MLKKCLVSYINHQFVIIICFWNFNSKPSGDHLWSDWEQSEAFLKRFGITRDAVRCDRARHAGQLAVTCACATESLKTSPTSASSIELPACQFARFRRNAIVKLLYFVAHIQWYMDFDGTSTHRAWGCHRITRHGARGRSASRAMPKRSRNLGVSALTSEWSRDVFEGKVFKNENSKIDGIYRILGTFWAFLQ